MEVEINDDGYCNYVDFLKNSTRYLDEAEIAQPNPHPESQPRNHIHGLVRDEFIQVLAQKLSEYQTTGSGSLDRKAIRDALNDEELGLRQKEINLAMGFIESAYPDGTFDYNELARELHELLFNAHEDNTLNLPFHYQQVEDIIIRSAEEMLETEKYACSVVIFLISMHYYLFFFYFCYDSLSSSFLSFPLSFSLLYSPFSSSFSSLFLHYPLFYSCVCFFLFSLLQSEQAASSSCHHVCAVQLWPWLHRCADTCYHWSPGYSHTGCELRRIRSLHLTLGCCLPGRH